jgi:hypothetical protein
VNSVLSHRNDFVAIFSGIIRIFVVTRMRKAAAEILASEFGFRYPGVDGSLRELDNKKDRPLLPSHHNLTKEPHQCWGSETNGLGSKRNVVEKCEVLGNL